MRSYADLRPDRATEILEQINGPHPFLASIAFVRPDVKRWTVELIDTVLRLARYVEQRVKHGLAVRRPNEYSPQVQPIILTPGHGALPSGHATEAFATARVLRELLRQSGSPYGDASYGRQFFRLAARMAINRTVAGVHFPIDSVAGSLLGLTLADYFLARVGAAYSDANPRVYLAAHFDGRCGAPMSISCGRTSSTLAIPSPAARFGVQWGVHPSVQRFTVPPGGANSAVDLSPLPICVRCARVPVGARARGMDVSARDA